MGTKAGKIPSSPVVAPVVRRLSTNAASPTQLALQRALGNRAAQGVILQRKLAVGPAGDQYEQEADRVAEQVVEHLGADQVQMMAPEEEELLQGKLEVGAEGGELSAETESQLQSARAGGAPLAPELRVQMETAFGGADFSQVRVHQGAQAAQLNRTIQAKAFTVGSDIFLGDSVEPATTKAGQSLLAHELTHTIQQGGSAQG